MGTWKYKKPEASDVRGICVICKTRPQGKNKDKYRPTCNYCRKKEYGKGDEKSQRKRYKLKTIRPYREALKATCEKCGFVPVNSCQLDIHHVDWDHENNDASNLKTLCANCHRLEHFK
jgi:hypothetical protein